MKSIHKTLLLLGLTFSGFSGYAQTVPTGLDSVLNKTLDSMRTVLNVKSLSAAIQFPDSVAWSRANGISSLNPQVDVTTDDVYLIGSITKTLTSACVLQLVDENLLSLDDSLHQWLDTMNYINPNITIRQLLRHQSGIYDIFSNSNSQPAFINQTDSIWAPQDLISTFVQAPLFQPGTSWSYSSTNYLLLGMIIQQATGHPYYEELRSRFFTPMGMNSIGIPSFEPLTAPVAHVWMDLNGDGINEDGHDFYINYLSLNSAAGAAGGYFATPTEISKWMRSYMRGDLLSILSMAEAKSTVNSPGLPGCTYGLGLMKKTFAGYQGYGHGGDLAYAASSWYFPAKDIAISVFTNDSKNNSWTLVPVVTALLKRYNGYMATVNLEESESAIQLTAYPNPIEDQIHVQLRLTVPAQSLQLILTNLAGQTIATLDQTSLAAGEHTLTFTQPDLAAGTYFITLIKDGAEVNAISVRK